MPLALVFLVLDLVTLFRQKVFSKYNSRNKSIFYLSPVNSVYNGTESFSQMAPKMRTDFQQTQSTISLFEFKNAAEL